jgi:hypothetical protein
MNTAQQISKINKEFTNGLQRILGDKLHGAYVYGAAAFDDAFPTGDIDFHVILNENLTGIDKRHLEEFHEELAKKFPPLGAELDGYYILLEDAQKKTPPQSQMWKLATDNAWALHREHIRAGRYINLHGGDPRKIYPPTTWSEIEAALLDELRYIKEHLDQYPDYCILNLCRLIYSFTTRDVVISKARASEWAFDELPEWKQIIELARKSYEGKVTSADKEKLFAEAGKFFEYATTQIDKLQKDYSGDKHTHEKGSSG